MTDFLNTPTTSGFLPYLTNTARKNFNLDPWLTILLGLVAVFGLVVLYSSLGKDQAAVVALVVKLGFGFALMVAACCISPLTYFRLTPMIYVGVVLLLVVVMFFGESAKGSQRWLDLPGLPRFQPSELLKLAIPLMIGWYFCLRSFKLKLLDFCVVLAIAGIPTALVLLQPDYGTAMILLLGTAGVLFVVGLRWYWIVLAIVLFAALVPFAWLYLLHDYHRTRISILFNPDSDPQNAGWNILQSKTAIGSGGLTGKGLFNGTQSQLDFLPEGHTDFVLAVIGEELGFVWCTLLLLCYLLIFIRVLYLSIRSSNGFGHLVSAGIAIIFFLYVVVNVAMVLGLLPVIGLPLPLVSYGGTSAVSTLVSFGVVMAICTRKQWMDRE